MIPGTGDDILAWLVSWYIEQCDGEWEHAYGLSLDTLDNPGWVVVVDAPNGRSFGVDRPLSRRDIAEDHWVFLDIVGGKLRGVGSARHLLELLGEIRSCLLEFSS